MDVTLSDLRLALARRELVYHYQPKVSLLLGGVCGAEALLRWRRPDGTLAPPGAFIPLAESTGFITEITLAMLSQLAEDVETVRAADPGLVVSFNASALDFEDGRLVKALLDLLASGRLRAGEIEVEVTETAMLAAGPGHLRRLAQLRERGIGIAMDDFGLGYSGLDTLSRLPFTALKIDQGIVQRMEVSDKDATIVESSIWLAHRLGLEVVAEGVETEQAFNLLQGAGCSIAQGYWFARPMPLPEFVAFVRSGPRWPSGALGLIHLAMLDHLEWRKALIDSLLATAHGEGSGVASMRRFAIDPTECRLGRWCHGAGRAFGDVLAYRALERAHAELHVHGRRLVEASERDACFAELAPTLQQLTACSTVLVGLLQELEHSVLTRIAEPRGLAAADGRAERETVPAA